MGETFIKRLAKYDFYFNSEEQTIELLDHTPLVKIHEEGYYEALDGFFKITQDDREALLSTLNKQNAA